MSDPCPCGPFRVRVPVPAEPAAIRQVVPSGIGATGKPGKDGERGPPGVEPDLPDLTLLFENRLV